MIRALSIGLAVALSAIVGSATSVRAEDPPRAFQGIDNTVFPEYPDAPPDAPTARLRIVFDPVSRSQEIAVEPNVPFEAYIVAYDVQIALRGWEAKLLIDERLTVLETEILADVNVGQGPEVYAALKPQNCESGEEIVVGRMRLMLTEPATDLTLGLAPTSKPSATTAPSEFDGPTPVYLVCRPEADVRPFASCEICAVVNPRQVEPEPDVETKPSAADLFGIERSRQR